MKLKEIKRARVKLVVLTGLHVGSTDAELSIGGVDNPVVRDPINDEPYIPGSSIKGKMRALMEWALGKIDPEKDARKAAHACSEPECKICRVFGAPASDENPPERGPTRLFVRDARLTSRGRDMLRKLQSLTGHDAELKQEVFVPRLGGDANPRTTERIPAGAEFEFELIYKVYDTGDGGKTDEKYFKEVVGEALRLLELDALGGHTSRGYGKIKLDCEVETAWPKGA